MRTMTLAPDDDSTTRATKQLGAADPVNKSFSERMNLFNKADRSVELQYEETDGGEEEAAE